MNDPNNQIELETGRHWKTKEGILYSEFFIPAGSPIVDASMINDHIDAADHLFEGERLTFLIDLTSSKSALSFDALKAWSESKVLNNYRLAEAYVVNSLADLIFLRQHIRLNKLTYPAKIFQSIKQAVEWLSTKENTTN